MLYSVHSVFRRMDEHRVLTVIVRNAGDEAHLYRHAHAQASPVVGPVAVAAAGSCGGGDRGFPPSAVGGWRGVDQYVKIESDATHPAIPPPPCPLSLFVPLVPLHHTPARQRYNRRCPVRLRVSRLNRLICHPRIIFFEGGWISRSLP